MQPLGVRRVAAAMVRVVDEAGRDLPAGAAVTVENDAATASSVAQDGAVFLGGAAGVLQRHAEPDFPFLSVPPHGERQAGAVDPLPDLGASRVQGGVLIGLIAAPCP